MAADLTPEQWLPILAAVNDYSMAVHDAASHESASKADIASSQALAALNRIRALAAALARPAADAAVAEGLAEVLRMILANNESLVGERSAREALAEYDASKEQSNG